MSTDEKDITAVAIASPRTEAEIDIIYGETVKAVQAYEMAFTAAYLEEDGLRTSFFFSSKAVVFAYRTLGLLRTIRTKTTTSST